MTTATASTYDLLVYTSKPQYATHPSCLATLATLLGLDPAPVTRCRVLEIGCATGGNLFPMAEALPQSQFLGIDPSARQIEIARQAGAALELTNLRFEPIGVDGLDDAFGSFDYILCHGVYSWVAPAVRSAILAACRRLLAPHGVAYVSYNVKPGWHLRLPVREMMQYHIRDISDPLEKVRQARAFMQFAAANPWDRASAWAGVLRDELELSGEKSDSYILHEHLEEDNEAFYFHEFMREASAHQLQFLAEAGSSLTPSLLPEPVRQTLQNLSEDLIAMEQYLDFLCGRMFRRTLLVRHDAPLSRVMNAGILDRLYLSARSQPRNPEVGIASDSPMTFANDMGSTVDVQRPILKAALLLLCDNWPQSIAYPEVIRRAAERVASMGQPADAATLAGLTASLVRLFPTNLVGVSVAPGMFVTSVSERPQASRLARFLAQCGLHVSNRLHTVSEIAGLDRTVLTLLDGTRDCATITEHLVERVVAGDLRISRGDQPVTQAEEARQLIAGELEGALQRLARSAVLVS